MIWQRVAIIAGGGCLPRYLLQSCRECGINCVLVRLQGACDADLSQYDGYDLKLGQVGMLLDILRQESCDAVVLAGYVQRPDFGAISLDKKALKLLPKVISASLKGNEVLLDFIINQFEHWGFSVIGVGDIDKRMLIPAGYLTRARPTRQEKKDILKAAEVLKALSPFDVGQGVIVSAGQVLAVEAVEGTDEMLVRVACLPKHLKKGAVFVKRPKIGQDLRVDLPTIGLKTIQGAISAGISGMVFDAFKSIFLDQKSSLDFANRNNFFLWGLEESLI